MIKVDSLPYLENQGLWDILLAKDILQYPLGYPSDQEYCLAYDSNWNYQDCSLIVQDNDVPLAGLQFTVGTSDRGQREINFFGRPALLRLNHEIPKGTLEKAEKLLAEHFLNHHQSLGSPLLNFLEMLKNGALSDFTLCLLKSGAMGTPLYKQIIDLTENEQSLRREVRKSYKSLISWGEKNLALTLYDHSNVTPEIIETFHRLHVEVAGCETRSAASWNIQYRQIVDGEAFLILGKLGDRLVTGALFLHSPGFCIYGVSASVRELFDKPLSHTVLWRAILEAKKIGCKVMEMGDLVYLYRDNYSDKEKNIALFKSGFGGHASVMLKISF